MAFFVPYFLTSFRRISMGLPHLADIMVAKGSAAQKGGGLKGGAEYVWPAQGSAKRTRVVQRSATTGVRAERGCESKRGGGGASGRPRRSVTALATASGRSQPSQPRRTLYQCRGRRT